MTALGLSTVVGVVSGLAPSYKAAKLDPIMHFGMSDKVFMCSSAKSL